MSNTQENHSESVWNQADLLARVDNDPEVLRELLVIFKEDFPRTMQSLQAAISSADLKNATSLSHTLKGMLSSLGGMRASAAAAKLERLASSGEKSSLLDALLALEREMASLLPEVDAYMMEVRG